MTRKVQIGSVSTGTLKTEDLLEAFIRELQEFDAFDQLTSADALLCNEADALRIACENEWLNDDGQDAASEMVNSLVDRLNELAPDFMYFGALEGDGADFGYWPSIDSLEDAARDGEVLKISAGDFVDGKYDGLVMAVTDHGNVTLYHHSAANGKFTEIWSCV